MTNAKPPDLGPRERILGGPTLGRGISDWWEDLIWPRVFGAARLGLRPGRLGLALFAVLIGWVLLDVGLAIDSRLVRAGVQFSWAARSGPEQFLAAPWRLYVSLPKALLLGAPITTLVIGPVLLGVVLVLMGAISRITACELGQGQKLTWTEGLSYSVARWRSLMGAILGPLVILWLIALTLGVGGWVLLRWPWLNVVGGMLYGLFLLAGFIAVLIVIGYALGHNLYVPAIACEGSDAIDAVQRGYTYVFARPLRLIFYFLVGMLGMVIVVGILGLIVQWTIGFAALGAGAWADKRGQMMIWKPAFEALSTVPRWGFEVPGNMTTEKTYTAGAWFIRLWTAVPVLLVAAAWISCGVAVSTATYLGIRRVCDGQDFEEIWEPGTVPGTMAESMAGRGRVAESMGIAAAGVSIQEEADYQ